MKKWTQLFFSNIGKRDENQDFLSLTSVRTHKRIIDVLIVCDGVGGRPDGGKCSNTVGKEVQKKVLHYLHKRNARKSLNENDLHLLKRKLSDLPELDAPPLSRTTLALVLFDRLKSKYGNGCITLWAGDSRIYAIEATGDAFQISNDQYNEDGHLSVVFSGDGKLIGDMGSRYIYFKDPLLICATSDGMNCQTKGLYKFLIACLYLNTRDNITFEKLTTEFLGNIISDNYSAAMIYKKHSPAIIKRAYKKISV